MKSISTTMKLTSPHYVLSHTNQDFLLHNVERLKYYSNYQITRRTNNLNNVFYAALLFLNVDEVPGEGLIRNFVDNRIELIQPPFNLDEKLLSDLCFDVQIELKTIYQKPIDRSLNMAPFDSMVVVSLNFYCKNPTVISEVACVKIQNNQIVQAMQFFPKISALEQAQLKQVKPDVLKNYQLKTSIPVPFSKDFQIKQSDLSCKDLLEMFVENKCDELKMQQNVIFIEFSELKSNTPIICSDSYSRQALTNLDVGTIHHISDVNFALHKTDLDIFVHQNIRIRNCKLHDGYCVLNHAFFLAYRYLGLECEIEEVQVITKKKQFRKPETSESVETHSKSHKLKSQSEARVSNKPKLLPPLDQVVVIDFEAYCTSPLAPSEFAAVLLPEMTSIHLFFKFDPVLRENSEEKCQFVFENVTKIPFKGEDLQRFESFQEFCSVEDFKQKFWGFVPRSAAICAKGTSLEKKILAQMGVDAKIYEFDDVAEALGVKTDFGDIHWGREMHYCKFHGQLEDKIVKPKDKEQMVHCALDDAWYLATFLKK